MQQLLAGKLIWVDYFKGTQAFNSVHGMDVLRQGGSLGILAPNNPLSKTIYAKLFEGGVKLDKKMIVDALNLMQQQARLNRWGYLTGIAGGGFKVLNAHGVHPGRIAYESLTGLMGVHAFGAIRRLMFITAGAALVETAWDRILSPLFDFHLDKYRRAYVRAKTFYMLSPQDDNLFPPSPANYMRLSANSDWDDFADTTSGVLGALLSIFTIGAWTEDDTEEIDNWMKSIDDPPIALLDKRLTRTEAQYTLYNSTIWDTFHEMSLRHPGHIYGTRPYGKKFEYRMFFGVPSQRYWSKPVTNGFISRMNELRKSFKVEADGSGSNGVTLNSLIDPQTYENLYGNEDIPNIRATAERKVGMSEVVPTSGTGSSHSQDYSAYQNAVDKQIRVLMTSRAMSEYLKGLEARFVPFRRYHTLSDKIDIISNNIISSEHNVINAVDVNFYNWRADATSPLGSTVIKAQSNIPDSELNMASVKLSKLQRISIFFKIWNGCVAAYHER